MQFKISWIWKTLVVMFIIIFIWLLIPQKPITPLEDLALLKQPLPDDHLFDDIRKMASGIEEAIQLGAPFSYDPELEARHRFLTDRFNQFVAENESLFVFDGSLHSRNRFIERLSEDLFVEIKVHRLHFLLIQTAHRELLAGNERGVDYLRSAARLTSLYHHNTTMHDIGVSLNRGFLLVEYIALHMPREYLTHEMIEWMPTHELISANLIQGLWHEYVLYIRALRYESVLDPNEPVLGERLMKNKFFFNGNKTEALMLYIFNQKRAMIERGSISAVVVNPSQKTIFDNSYGNNVLKAIAEYDEFILARQLEKAKVFDFFRIRLTLELQGENIDEANIKAKAQELGMHHLTNINQKGQLVVGSSIWSILERVEGLPLEIL